MHTACFRLKRVPAPVLWWKGALLIQEKTVKFWEKYKNVNLLHILEKNKTFNKFLQGWLEKKRNYFCSSPDRETFHRRLMWFYLPFIPFYINASPGKLLNWDILERRDFFIKHSVPRVIDVGMQDGYFVRELKKNGIDAVGVDSVKMLVNYAKKKDPSGEYYHCFAEELPFPDSTFQTAICSHLLEHVFKPEDVLKEVRRILKPGGKIIVVVPFNLDIEPTHLREYKNKEAIEKEVGRFFKIENYLERIGAGHGCIGIKVD